MHLRIYKSYLNLNVVFDAFIYLSFSFFHIDSIWVF